MQIWPFQPIQGSSVIYEWATDIIKTKTSEKRSVTRPQPRISLSAKYVLNDFEYFSAISILRMNDEITVPDWSRAVEISGANIGASVQINGSFTDIGIQTTDSVFIISDTDTFEVSTVSASTSGSITVDAITKNHGAGFVVPVFVCYSADGINVNRRPGQDNVVSINFFTNDTLNISAGSYTTYRSLPVMEADTYFTGAAVNETFGWDSYIHDNTTGVLSFFRERDIANHSLELSLFPRGYSQVYEALKWLYTVKGKAKAFWLSTRRQDLEFIGFNTPTQILVYDTQGLQQLGLQPQFNIDVYTLDGTHYYCQVQSFSTSVVVNGRDAIPINVDLSIVEPDSNIFSISYLACVRQDVDRLELIHSIDTAIKIRCVEVPEPVL